MRAPARQVSWLLHEAPLSVLDELTLELLEQLLLGTL
jgi:hypothetical protein